MPLAKYHGYCDLSDVFDGVIGGMDVVNSIAKVTNTTKVSVQEQGAIKFDRATLGNIPHAFVAACNIRTTHLLVCGEDFGVRLSVILLY
jgi:hypothetical protein